MVIPEGIRRSQIALRKALPELLQQPKFFRQWVAYHGEERIGIARANVELLPVLAGQVGIDQTQVIIEAFVDRRVRRGCGRDGDHYATRRGQHARGGPGKVQGGNRAGV